MVGICNSHMGVGGGLNHELYWQEAFGVPVISPSRADLVEIVGALFVNIKLSIS